MDQDPYLTRKTLLMRACNPDDEQAWQDFVSYYDSFIKMVLHRLLFQPGDHEDLRQEVLLKLWKKLQSYDENKSKFRTWLSTVIRNTVISHSRKKQRDFLHPEGHVLAMKPLILHSSFSSQSTQPRRVVHIEFANEDLPKPLSWL